MPPTIKTVEILHHPLFITFPQINCEKTLHLSSSSPGYNSDALSSSSPQISSSLVALAGSGSSVPLQATHLASRANTLPPGLRSIFVVALENGLRFLFTPCLLAGVTPMAEFFLTSFLQRTQKDDFIYFVVFLLGLHPTRSQKVLSTDPPSTRRMTLLFPPSRGTNVPRLRTSTLTAGFSKQRVFSLLLMLTPVSQTPFNQLPLRPPSQVVEPVMVRSSLEEDEVASPLLRKYLPLPGLSSFFNPFSLTEDLSALVDLPPGRTQGPLPPAVHVPTATRAGSSGHSATVVLEQEDHREEEDGVPLVIPRPSQSSRKLEKTPLPQSPAFPNHEELISCFSALGNKFFGLQGVVLQSYKGLLSSYEESSGSFSRVSQLENELKALRREKARKEGILQRCLRNLAGEHTTLQEKYATNIRCTEDVRSELEGVQDERDSALTGPALSVLSLALERTIQVVQARLEEAGLEVPATLWDLVRDDVPLPDPPNI
ncbi:hypothetical protein LIER_20534 [Lithospermum erythrorhizon]|uniref:Uncharacterized protein n=1 Tax=Lithospermum erythrorhizon TaxID=34254 RepID=A0AAV3QQX6_LITER